MLIFSCIVSTCFKWTLLFFRFSAFDRGSWSDAYVQSAIRYEDRAQAALDELKQKDLVSFTLIETVDGSPEMRGKWAETTLTDKGKGLLEELGLSYE